MKNLVTIIISACWLLIVNACSKESESAVDPVFGEISFTYNDSNYIQTQYADKSGVYSLNDLLSISIDMVDIFGGKIYFNNRYCAYLEPEFTEVYRSEGCNLQTITNGITAPIDSMKVFRYQSGSFNISLKDCISVQLSPVSTYMTLFCNASGTFDLTLVNNNNETIKITNGIIKNFTVF